MILCYSISLEISDEILLILSKPFSQLFFLLSLSVPSSPLTLITTSRYCLIHDTQEEASAEMRIPS